MKKVFALLLATAMLLSLVACGNQKASSGDDTGTNTSDQSGTNSGDDTGTSSDDQSGANSGDQSGTKVDMSKYPADFNEWTAQNLVDYFDEVVDFPSDCEIWVQDHATYWAGVPIYETSGIWNMDGACDVAIMFTVFNPDSPDTTPEEVEAVKQTIRDDKNHDYTTEEIFLGPQDHMIGNIAFYYSAMPNEEVYNAVDAAYNDLVEAMGLTPDF